MCILMFLYLIIIGSNLDKIHKQYFPSKISIEHSGRENVSVVCYKHFLNGFWSRLMKNATLAAPAVCVL